MPEVYGTDNAEGTVTVELVNNTVNMGVPGEYKLQYVTTDVAGNKAYNDIFITVVDTMAPVVTLIDGDMTIEVNTPFQDPGVTITDNSNEKLTANLTVYYSVDGADGTWIAAKDNKVDNTVLGHYAIWYSAKDSSGNVSNSVRRYVVVNDTTAPVVTLIDGDMTIEVNTPFQDPGVTITDNSNEKLTANLTVYYSVDGADGTWIAAKDNKVDNTVLGHYAIWYSAKDSSGNVSNSVRRYVIVKAKDTVNPRVTIVNPAESEVELESDHIYQNAIDLVFSDNSGKVKFYIDRDHGYTNELDLITNTKPIYVTSGYSWLIGKSDGLSIYIVDEAGNAKFYSNIVIED